MTFLFENLDVYQKSLIWIETVEALNQNLKSKVSYSLLDQLSRASTSIPLNIAEGNGRWHKPDKRQFFWIARGSAFECVPLIQVLYRRGLIEEIKYKNCHAQLDSLAKMLTKLIQSVENIGGNKVQNEANHDQPA